MCIRDRIEIDVKYAGYIARAERRAAQARKLQGVNLPSDLDYRALTALSSEVRERLAEARPTTLGQASRLPGVTPAAVSVLAAVLSKRLASRAG